MPHEPIRLRNARQCVIIFQSILTIDQYSRAYLEENTVPQMYGSLFSILIRVNMQPGGVRKREAGAFVLVLLQLCSSGLASSQFETNLLIEQRGRISETLGQVAKTVVYGGAEFMRLNNRILCPTLTPSNDTDNGDQPTLYIFNNASQQRRAFRIYADDPINSELLKEARLDPTQMTQLFVHGWLGGVKNEMWLDAAKDAALASSLRSSNSFRPNVIVVDWSDLAHGTLYFATRNSLKVSDRLARLLRDIVRVSGLKPELMHCFGHSIGTHICGQAARLAFPGGGPRFGRITGLDPGGFCYEMGVEQESTYMGLKPSDALLVDNYYTNIAPFGNRYYVGKYNIRVNNGYFQRACSVWHNPMVASDYFWAAYNFLSGGSGNNEKLTCDHYFATRFTNQTTGPDCSYVGYACDSYENYLRGRCGSCDSAEQCYVMDFEYQKAKPSTSEALEQIEKYSTLLGPSPDSATPEMPPGGVPYAQRGVYYMQTSDEEPYCSMTFRVRVKIDQEMADLGSFKSRWLQLRLMDANEQGIEVRDAKNGKLTIDIELHGPWSDLSAEEERYLDNRTLTGLFELPSKWRNRVKPIRDAVLVYGDQLERLRHPMRKLAEAIKIDYLSSSRAESRMANSLTFEDTHLKVLYKYRE